MTRLERVRDLMSNNEFKKENVFKDFNTIYPDVDAGELRPVSESNQIYSYDFFYSARNHSYDEDAFSRVIVHNDIPTLKFIISAYRNEIPISNKWIPKVAAASANAEIIHLFEQLDFTFDSNTFVFIIEYMGRLIGAYDLLHDEQYLTHAKTLVDIVNYGLNHEWAIRAKFTDIEPTDRESLVQFLLHFTRHFMSQNRQKIYWPYELCFEALPINNNIRQEEIMTAYLCNQHMFEQIIIATHKSVNDHSIRRTLYTAAKMHKLGIVQFLIETCKYTYDDLKFYMQGNKQLFIFCSNYFRLEFTQDEVSQLCNSILLGYSYFYDGNLLKYLINTYHCQFLNDVSLQRSLRSAHYKCHYPQRIASIWKTQFNNVSEFEHWLDGVGVRAREQMKKYVPELN